MPSFSEHQRRVKSGGTKQHDKCLMCRQVGYHGDHLWEISATFSGFPLRDGTGHGRRLEQETVVRDARQG